MGDPRAAYEPLVYSYRRSMGDSCLIHGRLMGYYPYHHG